MFRGSRTTPSEFLRGIMQRRQVKIKKQMILWLLCGCLSFAAMSCGIVAEEGENTAGIHNTQSTDNINSTDKKQDNGGIPTASTLQAHFIDVGQGDATLITCDGHTMLIDAGKNDTGTALQYYLDKQGITSLDYIIGTHPDEDHIGGMDVILTKFDCETVMLPNCEKDTTSYRDVISAIEYKAYQITRPVVGATYTLGSASFTVIAPNRSEYEDINNMSIGILLNHGENSFLFTGDAEAEAEEDILCNGIDIDADVLHVGHHGNERGTTAAFMEAVTPTYAVISCERDNSYGHPHSRTLKTLQENGVELFRTDIQGCVVAYSDGEKITWSQEPTESWQSGEELAKEPFTPNYILNLKSMKFHSPGCESVADMMEWNKKESTLSRDEVVALGYAPCGNCKP